MFFDTPQTTNQMDTSNQSPDPKEANNNSDASALQAEETYQKRYDDLRAFMDRKITDLENSNRALEEQLKNNKRSDMKSPKTKEELEAFRTQYPDLVDSITSIAQNQFKELVTDLEDEISSLRTSSNKVSKQSIIQEVKAKHPDVNDLQYDSEFINWYTTELTPKEQNVFQNPESAGEVNRLLDAFKIQTNRSTKGNTKDSGIIPDVKGSANLDLAEGKKIWRESELRSMAQKGPREFIKYEKEIEAALKEGRYLNDIN